jgi:hypothetical protein
MLGASGKRTGARAHTPVHFGRLVHLLAAACRRLLVSRSCTRGSRPVARGSRPATRGYRFSRSRHNSATRGSRSATRGSRSGARGSRSGARGSRSGARGSRKIRSRLRISHARLRIITRGTSPATRARQTVVVGSRSSLLTARSVTRGRPAVAFAAASPVGRSWPGLIGRRAAGPGEGPIVLGRGEVPSSSRACRSRVGPRCAHGSALAARVFSSTLFPLLN